MYSYIFLLVTLSGLLRASVDGSSVGVKTASANATIRSTATFLTRARAFQSGYKLHPGIGVLKFHNTLADWNEARETCIREGAHLAVIDSAYEESTIAEFQAINDIGAFWIGIHDQFKSRNWVTVMDRPIGYVHWNTNEPNNTGGNEHCVAYEKTGYNDLDCNQKRMFVCKLYL